MKHISRHYIGETATFTPRIPVSQNRCEIDLAPRVCAAETLEQCWEAINGCDDLITEMKKNNVTGYYFFVYEFKDRSSFVQNNSVKDFSVTGEMVSYVQVEAELVDVFYVDIWRLRNPLNGFEKTKPAKEAATIDEAIPAYKNWQKVDLLNIEYIVNKMNWEL